MNRFAALLAVVLIGAAVPAAAEAQGRGPFAECPQGKAGRACRDAARGDRDEARPEVRSRPPGRGNSLGDGWAPREDDARDGVRGGRLVPLEQVIRNISRMTPGRLLDAGLEGGSRPVYRVRWQTNDGRRIDYIVDARTGAIIGRN